MAKAGWFGESWGAPINDPTTEISVPVGQPCVRCWYEFGAEDQGVGVPMAEQPGLIYYHLDCFLREIGAK